MAPRRNSLNLAGRHLHFQYKAHRMAVHHRLRHLLFPLQYHLHDERHLLLGHGAVARPRRQLQERIHSARNPLCRHRRDAGDCRHSGADRRQRHHRRQCPDSLRHPCHRYLCVCPALPVRDHLRRKRRPVLPGGGAPEGQLPHHPLDHLRQPPARDRGSDLPAPADRQPDHHGRRRLYLHLF